MALPMPLVEPVTMATLAGEIEQQLHGRTPLNRRLISRHHRAFLGGVSGQARTDPEILGEHFDGYRLSPRRRPAARPGRCAAALRTPRRGC